MEILYILVPIVLVFVAIAIKILFWAINSGQYDDLNTEANRILFDEKRPAAQKSTTAVGDQKPAMKQNVSEPNDHE
ncbi:cbb3-type cytochrome oxidase assembly protein CcoS [Halioxenophilus sp. WMMB6]|uniref:cbb3-type cytochrome oxidase assembly protein CcoS n=1 Tax=Halioxenophilus sp. WMMB6 TaxID=3073815 RepID=UPI00295F2421|nr:cbb3-type cytochrome oxidase assembly protein CcoS [Halioxenophilus sp. WMMB6]